MRLCFEPEDSAGFEKAKAKLLHRFEEWLGMLDDDRSGHEASDLPGPAGVALDWKWGYGNGDLASWQPADVAEYLLDWCPRKLSVPQEECRRFPLALGALLEFLEDSALLSPAVESKPATSRPGSGRLDELLDTIQAVFPDYVEAMGDPSQFGMAKSLFGAAAAEGVDLEDEEALQRWMADFNARPVEERRRLLPQSGPAPRPPARPPLPPVALPEEAVARASAAAAPVLEKFQALAEYVGEGRRLTQKGNLTLADARALVDLLGTGDVMDQRIGERTFRTVSSKELPGLRQLFAWAKKAGVVKVVHNKVVATKQGRRRLHKDPVASFERAFSSLLDIGPLASRRDPNGWFAWPEVTALLDGLTLALLAGPYAAQRPIPLDAMAHMAAKAVLGAFEFARLTDETVAKRVERDVADAMCSLALAGALILHEGGEEEATTVELTPAGVVVVQRLLRQAGYDAPTAGRMSNASALELLQAADELGLVALIGELNAWRARRSPEQAAREMADAIPQLDDPGLANLALAIMADIGVEVSAPLVRQLAAEPRLWGLAMCWLVDNGLEPATALYRSDDVDSFVDVLACRMVTAGPEGLADTLALVGHHDQQVALMARLWRVGSPATLLVLEAVGATHPVKAVAKAARKASYQHRSWLANA